MINGIKRVKLLRLGITQKEDIRVDIEKIKIEENI